MRDNRQGWLILGGVAAGAGLLSVVLVVTNPSPSAQQVEQPSEAAAASVTDSTVAPMEGVFDAGLGSAEEEEVARQEAQAARRERERRALAAVNRAREQSGSANLYQFIHQAAKQAQQGESGVIEISNRGARVSRRFVRDSVSEAPPGSEEGEAEEGRSLADVLAEAQRELRRRQARGSRRVQALEPSPRIPSEERAAGAADEE